MLEWLKIKKKDEDIFKKISEKRDSECAMLSNLCFQKCNYVKDHSNNLIKHCDEEVLRWEMVVYLYLIDKNITPFIHVKKDVIKYETFDKISVYEYLKTYVKKNFCFKYLLNELFGFICKFREYNFLHGNLHIHNIFINKDQFIRKGDFYVIDYSNSFLMDKNITSKLPEYQRSSYLQETDLKIQSIFFEYWDFFTLYISLLPHIHCKDNKKYLNDLIKTYIKQDNLNRFLSEYEKYKETNIVVYHLDNPTFVNG
jgi:hypothetical protein